MAEFANICFMKIADFCKVKTAGRTIDDIPILLFAFCIYNPDKSHAGIYSSVAAWKSWV